MVVIRALGGVKIIFKLKNSIKVPQNTTQENKNFKIKDTKYTNLPGLRQNNVPI